VSALLPRISRLVADAVFDSFGEAPLEGSASHPLQVFAPVGGQRSDEAELLATRDAVIALAAEHGYPDERLDLIAFDREAARVLKTRFDLTWAEAGARDVWSFVALVLLPEVTDWRFGRGNRERWIASDLTRHTWGRLWWQAAAFEEDLSLLDRFTESDLNQLLERRSIGGDPRLLRAIGIALLSPAVEDVARRHLIRDATARLLRRLAFVDARSLDDEGVSRLCEMTVTTSAEALRMDPGYAPEP
jgi:hypothetical protein